MKLITYVPTEWDLLLERCLTSMDDQAQERLDRRREVVARLLAKRGLKEPPVDKQKVKDFLLNYAKLEKRHGKCMEEVGISKGDLLAAYDLWPESRFVMEYLREKRHQARELDNEDMLDEAREGISMMNTVEECRLNAKTLIHTISSLDRKTFGDAKHGGAGGRSQVTYVIPSLTVNNIMAPDEIAERLKAQARRTAMAQGRVVEAEAVSIGA